MEILRRYGDRIAVGAFAILLLGYGCSRWSGWTAEKKFRDDLQRLKEKITSLENQPPEERKFGDRNAKWFESESKPPMEPDPILHDIVTYPVPPPQITNNGHGDEEKKKPPEPVTVLLVRGARDPLRVEHRRPVKSWVEDSTAPIGPVVKIEDPPDSKGRFLLATAVGEKDREARILAKTEEPPDLLYIFRIEKDVRLPEIGEVSAEPAEGRATVRWKLVGGGADAGIKGFCVDRARVYSEEAGRAAEWERASAAAPGGLAPAGTLSFLDTGLAARSTYRWRVWPVAAPLSGGPGERLGSGKESAPVRTPEEVRITFRSMGAAGATIRGQFRVEKFLRNRGFWAPPRDFWADVLGDREDRRSQVGGVVTARPSPDRPQEDWDYSTGWTLLDILDERIPQPPREEPKLGRDGKPVIGADGKPETVKINQPDKKIVSAILLDPDEQVVRLELSATTGRVPAPGPAVPVPAAAERAPAVPEIVAGTPSEFHWVQIEDVISDRYTLIDGGGARAIVGALEGVAALGFEKGRIVRAKIAAGESILRSPTSLKDVRFRTIREWEASAGKVDKVLAHGQWNQNQFYSVKLADVIDDKQAVLEDANGARAILEAGGSLASHGFEKKPGSPIIVEARVRDRTAEIKSKRDGKLVRFMVVSAWK